MGWVAFMGINTRNTGSCSEICDHIARLLVSRLSICLLKRELAPFPPLQNEIGAEEAIRFDMCGGGCINNTGWPDGSANEL
jgi:hypothetical protein